MPRKIGIALAAVFFIAVTVLFLDPSDPLRHVLGWTAKMQQLPAVLSLNLAVIICTVLLTLIFGRVYCSIVCHQSIRIPDELHRIDRHIGALKQDRL